MKKTKRNLFHQDSALGNENNELNELDFNLPPHSLFSSDLAPSNYWQNADFKKMLQEQIFAGT